MNNQLKKYIIEGTKAYFYSWECFQKAADVTTNTKLFKTLNVMIQKMDLAFYDFSSQIRDTKNEA